MIERAMVTLARVRPVPLLVRFAAAVAGLAAFLVVMPLAVWVVPMVAVALVALAAAPAIAPSGPWATLVTLAAVAGWLVSTEWYGQPVRVLPVLAMAGLLYLLHVLASLAAGLPYDAVTGPQVLARWLSQALPVILGSGLLIGVVLVGLPAVPAAGGFVGSTLAGLALAGAVALLLGRGYRRRPER